MGKKTKKASPKAEKKARKKDPANGSGMMSSRIGESENRIPGQKSETEDFDRQGDTPVKEGAEAVPPGQEQKKQTAAAVEEIIKSPAEFSSGTGHETVSSSGLYPDNPAQPAPGFYEEPVPVLENSTDRVSSELAGPDAAVSGTSLITSSAVLPAKQSFVEFVRVYKRYRMGDVTITASNDINFSIDEGEFALIVGASGAGKTTVLNMLGGIDSADEGQIIVDGTDIAVFSASRLTQYRRYDIGFVFQFYNLMPNLTVKENVELASQIVKNAWDAEEILSQVELSGRLRNFPAQLSGGEQQRVSIARALAKRPKLLLCDEPTGALDYNTGRVILTLLHETCKKQNMTVIVITHNTALTPIADRVITMRNSTVESVVINKKPAAIENIEW